jgi:membrane-associated phospholipid phosphatase
MRTARAPLIAAFACAGALALLALLVYGVGAVQRLDATALSHLIVEQGSRPDSLAAGLTPIGDMPTLLVMLALARGIGLMRGRPREAAAAFAVVAGANLTTQALKVVVFSHPRLRAILGAEPFEWDGFPSGHVTAVASIAIAFVLVVPQRLRPMIAAVGTCLVAAVGWAVVALNWHYPSDVLGGALVASAWGLLALAALRAAKGRHGRRVPQLGSRAAISVK